MNKIIYKIGNKIVRRTNWYNNSFWNGATKFWQMNCFGLDVVNLGSGQGFYAFNYNGIDVKAQNWALSPQSLLHDYNILKNYFSYIREGGYVFITLCPFSCLVSQYDKKHNFKYYTFLHPATIQNFEDNERSRALQIKNNPFKEMPTYCIKQTIKEILHTLKKKVFSEKKDLQLSAEQMMTGWKNQFGIKDLSEPISEQHLKELICRRKTLDEMIEFCKERSLIPIIIYPPMFHTLTTLFPSQFRVNYVQNFLNGIEAQVLDYMNSKEFDKEDYFSTALFLNQQGSKLFTKRVLMDLGIIKNNSILSKNRTE